MHAAALLHTDLPQPDAALMCRCLTEFPGLARAGVIACLPLALSPAEAALLAADPHTLAACRSRPPGPGVAWM